MQPSRFLVTGGSQGIGAAIVEQARNAGQLVWFTGRNKGSSTRWREGPAPSACRPMSLIDENARTVDAQYRTHGRHRRPREQRGLRLSWWRSARWTSRK